jgi:hypothetical protein
MGIARIEFENSLRGIQIDSNISNMVFILEGESKGKQ